MAEGGGSKLSEERIFECLKSLNVPVRMNELKAPTREFIIRVFTCFLKDLQIDISNPVLRPFEAVKHIEDGDIYEEGMLISLLAISVNHITSNLNLGITIKDIVEPKPKRTKKILNYLLVFWKYYLQQYAQYTAVEETFENERKKREDLINENESLDQKIADKLNILQNMEPTKEELERIHDAKLEKLTKLEKESKSVQDKYYELKEKDCELKQEISNAELNIVKAKETLGELSQLILSSPKQKLINTEIRTLEEKIKEIDAKIKEYETAYKDEMKSLQLLEDYQKDEQKVKNSLNEIGDIDKQLSETVKDMVDVHQQNIDVEDKLRRLEIDLEGKGAWQEQKNQKFQQLTLNHKKQLETLRELLKQNQSEEAKVKNQVEFVRSAVQDVQSNIDTESDMILGLEKKYKEVDTKSKEREAEFKNKLKEISNVFESDCEEVLKTIEEVLPI